MKCPSVLSEALRLNKLNKDGCFATRQCDSEVSGPHDVSQTREDAGAVSQCTRYREERLNACECASINVKHMYY